MNININPIFQKTKSSLSESLLIGPYLRAENVHIDETHVLFRYLRRHPKSQVMIDVGAHTGTACIPFLEAGWRVIAFEPNHLNNRHLKNKVANSAAEFQENFALHEICLGDKQQTSVPFYFSEVSSGISGLSRFHKSHKELTKVDVDTLTNVLREYELPGVDFLKIDTEGYDYFVLKGFPWDRFKPRLIECEFENGKTVPLGYDWKVLADFLLQKGYKVLVSEWHPIIEYGLKHDWNCLKSYPCELDSDKTWGNLIAVSDEVDFKEIILQFEDAPFYGVTPERPLSFVRDSVSGNVKPTSQQQYVIFNGKTDYLRKIFLGHFLPSTKLTANLKFSTSGPCTLIVKLIRHGDGRPELTQKKFRLAQGRQSISLDHNIQYYQPYFGVQIHCEKPEQVTLSDMHVQLFGATVSLSDERLTLSTNKVPQTIIGHVNNPAGKPSEFDNVLSRRLGIIAELSFYLSSLIKPCRPADEKAVALVSLIGMAFKALPELQPNDIKQLKAVVNTVLDGLEAQATPLMVLNPDSCPVDETFIEGRYVRCIILSFENQMNDILLDNLELLCGVQYNFETEYSIDLDNSAYISLIDTNDRVLRRVMLKRGYNKLHSEYFTAPGTGTHKLSLKFENISKQSTFRWFQTKVYPIDDDRRRNIAPQVLMREFSKPRRACSDSIFSPATDEPLLLEDIDRFMSLHNKFKGERIFVMGNGPSLNKTPLEKLKDDYVFGLNRVSLLFDRVSWRPTFFTAFDVRVVPDNAAEFSNLDIPYKFFSARYKKLIGDRENHYWHHVKGFYGGFDQCFDQSVVYTGFGGGGTIAVIAIELAFFMGFDPIYLIGTDVSYTVPNTVKQSGKDEFGDGVKLELTSTQDDDANHFDPRYFGAGKKWHNPNVRDMKIGFARAASYIQKRDRRLLNATVGGELDEIPRIDFESLF